MIYKKKTHQGCAWITWAVWRVTRVFSPEVWGSVSTLS